MLDKHYQSERMHEHNCSTGFQPVPCTIIDAPRHGLKTRATWKKTSHIVFGLTGLVLVWFVTGCQSARVSQPLTRTITCNDDAFHGLILYLDQSDPNSDYVSRVEALKSRGLLPRGFDRSGDEAVT